jgi:hypothetical protein
MLAALESLRVPVNKKRMLLVAQLLLGPSLPDKERPSPSRLGVGYGADISLVKAKFF